MGNIIITTDTLLAAEFRGPSVRGSMSCKETLRHKAMSFCFWKIKISLKKCHASNSPKKKKCCICCAVEMRRNV